VFGFVLPTLDRAFVSPRLAAETARFRCGAEGPVALTGYREPSAVFLLGTGTLTGTGVDAAAALAEGRAPLAWVEARDADRFDAAAAERGLATVALATLDGFNYSRGRRARRGARAPRVGRGARRRPLRRRRGRARARDRRARHARRLQLQPRPPRQPDPARDARAGGALCPLTARARAAR
jgi:hypothetical protein